MANSRFWDKVVKGPAEDDCWLWTGCISGGYGMFSVGGKMVGAHRFSFELAGGRIPPGARLDHRHTCPKNCVHHRHLRISSAKENAENRAGPNVGNRSGYRGVSWNKSRRRWGAFVNHNQRLIFAGWFKTAAEAGEAARLKRLELFTHNDADREAV